MKTTTKVRWVFLAMIGMVGGLPFGTNGWAALYSGYVGNRTDGTGTVIDTAGGMSATGNSWAVTGNSTANKGVRLDWSVDPSGGNWVYTYTFTMASGAQKDIKNFDLQVAGAFGASDLVSTAVTPATGVTGPTPGSTLPASISENSATIATPTVLTIAKGYQWSFAGTQDYTFTMTVTTTSAPVWGDFIVSSGATTSTDYLTAYNSDFGAVKGAFPTTGGVYNGHVAVPGTATPHVISGGVPYVTLQNAFDNATDTMLALAITFTETPVFNRPGVSLPLLGGYDAAYTTASGWTTIGGSLTIANGTLTLGNVEIQ